MIQSKTNNLVSIAIFLLYMRCCQATKKVKMILGLKFQYKTESVRSKKTIHKKKTTVIKKRASILGHVLYNMDISKCHASDAATPSRF